MKSIIVKNLQIQFDSFDEGADKHTALNMLDEINLILQERFPDLTPQIFVNAIDDDDIEITPQDDEDEISEEEIKAFKEEWGQTHSEICANLDYCKKGSDELLMLDYFWVDADKKWYNKNASSFTEREQEIADYLRNQ
jgi:hypothetical protein